MSFRAALAAFALVATLPTSANVVRAAAPVTAQPMLLRTVAGSDGYGDATSLAAATRVLAHHDGVLYSVGSSGRGEVLRALDLETGEQRVVAGGERPRRFGEGPAGDLRIDDVKGLAVDGAGRIYVSDRQQVLKIEAGRVTTVPVVVDDLTAWNPFQPLTQSPGPMAASREGTLYLASGDPSFASVYAVSPVGERRLVAGGGTRIGCSVGPATTVALGQVRGLAVDGRGRLLVSTGQCVRRLEPSGDLVRVAGGAPDGGPDDAGRGDGGSALAARLDPGEIATDGDVLYVTDGMRIRRVSAGGTITTVAGNGEWRHRGTDSPPLSPEDVGDGQVATAVPVWPVALAAAGGALWFAEARRIRSVEDGVLGTVAGNGDDVSGGDGGRAFDAQLHHPSDIALTPDGGYVVATPFAKRVRKVGSDGTVSTIAGTGGNGLPGDGGPATAATLHAPRHVAAGPDGSVYVTGPRSIRRIGPDGVITRFAGDDSYDPPTDGVPATESSISAYGMDVGPDGSLYVAAYETNSVRRIGPDGIVETVAGGNGGGFAGDGGPATEAKLNGPLDVDVQPDGGFYVAEHLNDRVRYVSPAGVVVTVAGGGTKDGEGVVATAAVVRRPRTVTAGADGTFYVGLDDRVREVRAGTVRTVAGRENRNPYPSEEMPPDVVAATRDPLHGTGGLTLTPDGLMFAEPDAGRIRLLVPDAVPAAPTTVSATPGSRRATVRWTPLPAYQGSPVDSYTVTATPADGGSVVTRTVPATEREATLIRLRNGVDHAVAVHATNAAGDGPPSTTTVRPRPDPPGPPRYVTARAGDADAEVTWTRPDDHGSTLTGYRVTATPGGATVETEPGTRRAVVGGLANGTAYRFTVAARTASGWGAESPATPPVTPDGPPTPSLLPSAALRGPSVVRFPEPVRDVDAGNVVLRDRATGSGVAVDLECRTARDAAVVCGEDALSAVLVRPRTPLTAGATYDLLVNPDGARPVVDLDGFPAHARGKAFRASTSEQETTAGGVRLWKRVSDDRAEGGQYAVERQRGATATATVTGTRVTWLTAVGPDMGRAELWVDGVRRGTYDNRAAARAWRVPRTVTGLSNARHTVQVRVLDGSVVVDSLGGAVTYEWRRVPSAGASGGVYAVADLKGAETSFTFRGTGVDWYGVRGPGYGRVAVYVDGRRLADADYYAATTQHGYRRGVSGLADGVHTVRLFVLGSRSAAGTGTAFGLDRWQVTG